MSMCHSSRLYHCQRCHVQVIICSSCDRGQRYCAGSCSTDARTASLKLAAKKYQVTRSGTFNNAARQSRFRARKKEKVTHHCSPSNDTHVLLQPRFRLTVKNKKILSSDHNLHCHHCGKPCGSFLRHDFLRYK